MLSSFRSSPLYLKVNSFYPPKLQLILFLATFISTSQALPTTTTAATFPAPSTLFSFSALTTTTTTTNTTNTTILPSSSSQPLNSTTTITSTTSTPLLNSTNFTTTTTTTTITSSFSSSSPLPTLITPENSRVNDEEEKEGHSLPPDMGINKEAEGQMEKSDDDDDDVVNATFSCQCPIGYALAYSRKKCLRLVCETDYDCNRHMSVEVLTCASKKCVCRQHMHTSEDGFSCETNGELFVGIFATFFVCYAIYCPIVGVVIFGKFCEKSPAEPKETSSPPTAATTTTKKKKEKKDKRKKKKEKKKEKTKKKTEKEKKKKKQSTECKAVVAAEAVAEVTENS